MPSTTSRGKLLSCRNPQCPILLLQLQKPLANCYTHQIKQGRSSRNIPDLPHVVVESREAGHKLRKEVLSMFHIYLRIFRPRGQRSSQLQVGQGRAHCCAETAKPTEKKPATSFCQPPSQLVVKTGREEEKTHSRLPVPCFIPHNWVFS